MDGLSSDFTSASPFIAPAPVSRPPPKKSPKFAQKTHAGDADVHARSRPAPHTARIRPTYGDWHGRTFSSPLNVLFLLAGKRGRAYVTSLLREKHAWSICFDCGGLAGILACERQKVPPVRRAAAVPVPGSTGTGT